MMRSMTVVVVALAVTLVAGGVAYAPYHTTPTPPSSQPTSSALAAAVSQAKIAAAHAGYAAESGAVSGVREHLGHALVCIEGAKGKNVNAAWDNPCQGMGNGVLVDLERAKADAAVMARAKEADTVAVAAMQGSDLARMKAAAKQVSTLMAQVAQGK